MKIIKACNIKSSLEIGSSIEICDRLTQTAVISSY